MAGTVALVFERGATPHPIEEYEQPHRWRQLPRGTTMAAALIVVDAPPGVATNEGGRIFKHDGDRLPPGRHPTSLILVAEGGCLAAKIAPEDRLIGLYMQAELARWLSRQWEIADSGREEG